MSMWRKPLGVITLSGAVLGAAVLGVNVFHDTQFAQAEQQVNAARQDLAVVEDSSTVYRDIHRVVEPSVVEIQVTKTVHHAGTPIPPGFERFFHQFGGEGGGQGQFNIPMNPGDQGNDDQSSPDQGSVRETGTGSGVIMEESGGYGYILTNNHVAGGASQMVVTLSDGRVIKNAELVGADPKTDLAVVKIKADHLIPATWGDSSQLESGDHILAFGAPFGYVGSMTHGIVSALHRQAGILGNDGYENFIQVDAPINPGNSGGPLVNLKGQVVGVNTAIASSSGAFSGIGFAIPSEEARPIYDQLKSSGKISRGWLGVEIQSVSANTDAAENEGYHDTTGVMIHGVLHDSPSASQLHPGDIVTKLNGHSLADASELRNAVAVEAPGAKINLTVFRDGKTEEVSVKLGQQPSDLNSLASMNGGPAESNSVGRLGVKLENLNSDLAQQYGLSNGAGVVVTSVDPNSTAAQAGISEGDEITAINGHEVHTAADAQKAMAKADLTTGARLQITNRQGTEMVFVKAAK